MQLINHCVDSEMEFSGLDVNIVTHDRRLWVDTFIAANIGKTIESLQ